MAKKGEVIHLSELIKMIEQNEKKYLLLSAYVNGSEDSGYAFLETPRSIIAIIERGVSKNAYPLSSLPFT